MEDNALLIQYFLRSIQLTYTVEAKLYECCRKCEKTIKTGSSNPNGVISYLLVKHLNPTSVFCRTVHHSKNWSWINHLKITRRFFWSLLLLSFHKWNGNYVLIVVIFKFADAAHRQRNVFLKSWKGKRLMILNAMLKDKGKRHNWQVKRLFQTLIHRLPDSHKNTG